MNVLVVSGIWPPDVGGPATHGPEVAAFLHERGHGVEVVTTAAAPPPNAPYPVFAASRRTPKGLLHVRCVELVRRRAACADVVYTTGMFGRSAAGATLARRPYVVKLTADPAFERARRRGEVAGTVDEFQRGGGGVRGVLYRRARNTELRGAAHVVCPSEWLRELATTWGIDRAQVTVLPNPAPSSDALRSRGDLQRELALDGATLAFAGRLTAQKSLGVALEAVAAVDGVKLLIVGDGDERSTLERDVERLGLSSRVRFLGAQPRERVLELFRAADATILSSRWENFPHAVVESLAVGTPVLATTAGGVAEVVRDEVNGLLVAPACVDALARAIRRYFTDDALRERLRAAAAPSVAMFSRERVFCALEAILAAAAGA